jgi:uncharacterized membrane protein YsdA (DUF1294 family)
MSALLALLLLAAAPVSAIWIHAPDSLRLWLTCWLVFASVITFALYASDKRRSIAAARRTPEKILHLGALLGGWPGAFLAQRFLRHKNAKVSFQIIFWFIVAAHQLVALDLLFAGFISRTALP